MRGGGCLAEMEIVAVPSAVQLLWNNQEKNIQTQIIGWKFNFLN